MGRWPGSDGAPGGALGAGGPASGGSRGEAGGTGAAVSAQDLDELVRLHYERLTRLAWVLCGDRVEAEDIVAEAYARSWPRLSRGKVENPPAYLRRAVVNGVASWRRRRFVARRAELRQRTEPGGIGAGAGIEEMADRERLLLALRKLPLPQRQVVALRFLEDLTEAEVAATLEIPIGTVKSRAARGLSALRGILEEPEAPGMDRNTGLAPDNHTGICPPDNPDKSVTAAGVASGVTAGNPGEGVTTDSAGGSVIPDHSGEGVLPDRPGEMARGIPDARP